MPTYKIQVQAHTLRAEIEAENEDMAADMAANMFHDNYELDEVTVVNAEESVGV